MQITILGRRWNLRFAPNMANRGDCDPPTKPHKEIRISSELRGEERTEVIIHEITPAAFWHLDEGLVTEFASDLARVLSRLDR